MCRMFIHYSVQPKRIPFRFLKKFIKSCHWDYFKKYDIVGHHGAGWGYAYISEKSKKLIIKKTIQPIYKCKWQDLAKIKTRFLLVHARKTIFGEIKFENVHPISIGSKFNIVHNGTIKMDSFKDLNDAEFQYILNNTDLDTRKYLCTIMDHLREEVNIKKAVEKTLTNIRVSSAANAFLFNLNQCHIIKYQNNTFNGRHTTLFIDHNSNRLMISTTPLSSAALEISNKSLISITDLNYSELVLEFNKLSI